MTGSRESPSITFNDMGTRSNGEFDMMLKYLDGYGTIMGYLQSVKSADVDNDGEQELVFGNSEGYIYVLGNSPDGLTEEWKTMVGPYAFGLDLNDVDNDGIIEIVSGNQDGFINIFGFNGTTYIKEWTSPDLGSDLYGLKTSDIDDDGTIEIIAGASVTEILQDNLFVYQWNGATYEEDWSFALTTTLGYLGIYNIDVGDVDFDGDKEVVVATFENEVIANDPPVNPIPPNPRPNGQAGGRFYVFPYFGGLPEYQSDDFGEWVLGMAVDDTDGDGVPEIVISLYFSTVFVFKYDALTTLYLEMWSEDASAYSLTVGDVDGDDIADIIVSSWYHVNVYKNGGFINIYDLIWTSPNLDSLIYGLGNGHMDDDGVKEILVGSYYRLYVFGEAGGTFFQESESDNIGAIESIASADLDSNGIPEVFLGTGNGDIIVMEYNGITWVEEETISVSDRTITYMAVADVDNDTVEELVAVEGHTSTQWNENFIFRSASSDAYVHILEYSGSYVIEESIYIEVGGAFCAEVGDVDGDGIPEIVLGGTGYDEVNEDPFVGQIEVVDYDNESSSYSVVWESYYFANWVMGIALGDVDKDNSMEIVTEDYDADLETNLLRIFEWNGLTYAEVAYVPVDSENYALDIGDTDNDGILEIATKGIFSGLIEVFGKSGLTYNLEWSSSQFTTFIDECFALTNIEEGESEYLIFGELGVFVYQYIGSSYQQIWHSAEVPASIKTLHLSDVDDIPGKEIIGSSGGYNFIYGADKPPEAHLEVSKDVIDLFEEVQFNGSESQGKGSLEYLFDFDDGTDSGWVSSPIVTHSYSSSGTFSVSLIIKDDRDKESDPALAQVVVRPPNMVPRAEIDDIFPSPAVEEEPVNFQGHGEDDDGDIVAFEWTSSRDGNLSTSGTFISFSLSVGIHTIYFRVRDDRGDWSTSDTFKLKVEERNPLPEAEIISISPNPAIEGEQITFSGQASDDGFITSYNWESDLDGFLSSKDFFIISTLSIGEHTITFKVQDNDDAWSEPVHAILMVTDLPENVPPTAVIDGITPTDLKEGEAVTFFGHGEDEDGTIEDYLWESDTDGLLSDSRSFGTSDLSPGVHVITFRVRDDRGDWSNAVQTTLDVEEEEEEPPFIEFDIPEPFKDEPMLFWFLVIILVMVILALVVLAAVRRKGKGKKGGYEQVGGEQYYRNR